MYINFCILSCEVNTYIVYNSTDKLSAVRNLPIGGGVVFKLYILHFMQGS